MELRFECDCGEEISDFTRGVATEISTRVGCDECEATHTLTVSRIGNESPSFAIVRAISAVTETPAENLDPLAYTIDPAAIDAILADTERARITFEYYDLRIRVDSSEIVIIESGDE